MERNNSAADSRSAYQGSHLLADGYANPTDTWMTGINNNVMVFGPPGAGKTRNYVRPNLFHSHESMIVSDTKGILYHDLGPWLRKNGFDVKIVDFTDLSHSCGYNPMDHISFDPATGRYSEKDILTLAHCLIADLLKTDPFWDQSARMYLAALIGYVMEALPEKEHTLEYVNRLLYSVDAMELDAMMRELAMLKPDSTTASRYRAINSLRAAEKTDACIRGVISSNLDSMCFDEALYLYNRSDRIDFTDLGKRKTALFLTIPDADKSMDKLATTFMAQAIQKLIYYADHECPNGRLAVPVRLYLDDFASTASSIPDFNNTISVIRSREISVSIILQSLNQLYALYNNGAAKTIINNCDTHLYLGGVDIETAKYISMRADRPLPAILALPLDTAWLFVRGQKPVNVKKYDISEMEEELSDMHWKKQESPEAKTMESGVLESEEESEETLPETEKEAVA